LQDVVGRPRQLQPWHGGRRRRTAACNQDAIRPIALAFYFNGALVRDLGIAIRELYAGVTQHLTIDAFEAIQLFILGLRPATDIELRSHIAPAERRRFR